MRPSLPVDSVAEVVTDDLVVRSLPEISEASAIHPVRLQPGKLLFVLDGPATADDHDWYLVAPFDAQLSDVATDAPTLGWVAAGPPGEPWIAAWQGQCPEPVLDRMVFASPYLNLACHGSDELTLAGGLGNCSVVVPAYVTPAWLNSFVCELYPLEADASIVGPLAFYWEVNEPHTFEGDRMPVEVRGHFDHAAAQTCAEGTPPGDLEPTPPELVVLRCRTHFVALEMNEVNP
jgi:hypothetical protein